MTLHYVVINYVIESGPHLLDSTEVRNQLNTGNPETLTHEERVAGGVYPYVENDNPPAEHAEYYDRSLTDEQVNADNVSRDAVYTQWDIEDVKADKNLELESQLTEYSTNQLSLNEKVKEYVRNDVQWLADRQGELARIDDWQTAADYDTSKPDVLPLSEDYKGASYVAQGLELTAQNQAAAGAGQPERWDQAEVNTFVAANRVAAEDTSGGTPAMRPSYRLRQGIANVSEQFNRVTVFRYDVDDPNPALQRSFSMEMRNRQDSRNIYVFVYTNNIYLGWRLFEDQGDGVWRWDAHSSMKQYTDTDLNFIMSYGANPAVESDYFTDQIEYAAGVDEKDILVAWDTE